MSSSKNWDSVPNIGAIFSNLLLLFKRCLRLPLVSDPRFGRNSELPSEDPLVAGEYGKAYVRACQQGPDKKYLKMIAGLKV